MSSTRNKATLASAGSVTTLSAVMSGNGGAGSQLFRMMIYANGATCPTTLLATSNDVSVPNNAAQGTVNFPLPAAVALPAGDYWIAQQSGPITGPGHGCVSGASAAPGANQFNNDSFSDGPSPTYGATLTDSNQWSLSASGTTGSGSTTVTGISIGGPQCFFALGGVSPCPGKCRPTWCSRRTGPTSRPWCTRARTRSSSAV
jgi:hypothetical protein